MRGDTRLFHVYELAQVLDRHADDAGFWDVWSELHDPSLRSLEAICFSLAESWFLSVAREGAGGSGGVARGREAMARDACLVSIEGLFRPNKDELWLNCALAQSGRDRAAVVRRRLLPELARPVRRNARTKEPDHVVMRGRSRGSYLKYLASRLSASARTLAPLVRWFGAGLELGPGILAGFWVPKAFSISECSSLFLYNLYLLKLGFREDRADVRSHDRSEHRGFHPVGVCDPPFRHEENPDDGVRASGGAVPLRALVTSGPALLALAPLAGLRILGVAGGTGTGNRIRNHGEEQGARIQFRLRRGIAMRHIWQFAAAARLPGLDYAPALGFF